MQQNIASVYQDTGNNDSSMQSASDELRNMANEKFGQKNEVADIAVFCDGTWQRRGFLSLNGVVIGFASDTIKCVDYRVKSKQCASCVHHGSLKKVLTEPNLYEQLISKHDWDINHEGSGGDMEVSGLIECFTESEKNRLLRYTSYIGNGESITVKLLSEVKCCS